MAKFDVSVLMCYMYIYQTTNSAFFNFLTESAQFLAKSHRVDVCESILSDYQDLDLCLRP